MLSSSEVDALHIVRHRLSGLRVDASLVRLQLALKAGFNPDQTRVARGRREGGQWMRDGAGTSVPSVPTGPATPPRPNAGVIRDETGLESWEAVVPNARPDGVHQLVAVNRDGSLIRSEYSTSPESTGWEERHTVIRPDGEMRTFEQVGEQQTVRDRNGIILTQSTWTSGGPVPEPRVELALLAPNERDTAFRTFQLGIVLFNWLSSTTSGDKQPVVGFSAYDFRPNANSSPDLLFVGLATNNDVEEACPRFGEVQARANDAVDAVKRSGAVDISPAVFGTAVHVNLKHQIDALDDPSFKAEVSALKSGDVRYGTKDSVRIDVFENVDDETVCVYDIKTGRSGLTVARANEISAKVFASYPWARRILVIEIRTKQ